MRFLPVLFLFGLWVILWGSLGAQDYRWTIHPDGVRNFLLVGLRSAFPLLAAYLAIVVLLTKLRREPRVSLLLSPLGLLALYGLMGLVAVPLSPMPWVALYWTIAYLAVPLAIWAVAWSTDSLDRIARLIELNWLILVLLVGALFVVSLFYLGVAHNILHPESILSCRPGRTWFDLTSGLLRQTGVGRYAAITALIALSGLSQKKWRFLWGIALLACLILLLNSGARTGMVGFAICAPVVILLHWGKRAFLAGAILVAIVVPLAWGTGMHETFFQNCLMRGYTTGTSLLKLSPSVLQVSEKKAQGPPPTIPDTSVASLHSEGSQTPDLILLEAREGEWVLELVSDHIKTDITSPGILLVPSSQWTLEVSPQPVPNPLPRLPSTLPVQDAADPSPAVLPTSKPLETSGTTPAAQQVTNPSPAVLPTSKPLETSGTTATVADGLVQVNSTVTAMASINLPAGKWELKSVSQADLTESNSQQIIHIPKGSWELKPHSLVESISPQLDIKQPRESLSSQVSLPVEPASKSASTAETGTEDTPKKGVIPKGFYTLSGRTVVWSAAWDLFQQSPWLGYGFHADRMILGTHMHNALLHALFQSGVAGTIPLVTAVIFGWVLMLKAFWNLRQFPTRHKHLVIQAGAVLIFLTIRSIPESSGAFFGIDLLLLAPLLLYFGLVNKRGFTNEEAH